MASKKLKKLFAKSPFPQTAAILVRVGSSGCSAAGFINAKLNSFGLKVKKIAAKESRSQRGENKGETGQENPSAVVFQNGATEQIVLPNVWRS